MAVITNQNFPTSKQIPDHSIMDSFSKQAYLGNQFMASTGSVTLPDTSEKPILYIANAAANKVSLFLGTRMFFAGDVTNSVTFRVYYAATSVSGGSAITPANCRQAMLNLSVATATLNPTVGGNGTLVNLFPTGLNGSLVDQTCLILDPGFNLLITAKGSAATSCAAEAVWWEL